MIRTLAYLVVLATLGLYVPLVFVEWYFQPLRNSVPLASNSLGSVFLKREAMGWDRDRMAISGDPNPCAPIGNEGDYIFHSMASKFGVVYKIDGNSLLLYVNSVTPAFPDDPSSVSWNIVRNNRSEVPHPTDDPEFERQGYRLAMVDIKGQRCKSFVRIFFTLAFDIVRASDWGNRRQTQLVRGIPIRTGIPPDLPVRF